MFPEMLPFVVTALLTIAAAMVFVVATRHPSLLPGTVHPFAPSSDPAADTISSEVMESTVLTETGDWKLVTLNRLCDVEELLDCLEASNVAEREVHTFGNNTFAVRWR